MKNLLLAFVFTGHLLWRKNLWHIFKPLEESLYLYIAKKGNFNFRLNIKDKKPYCTKAKNMTRSGALKKKQPHKIVMSLKNHCLKNSKTKYYETPRLTDGGISIRGLKIPAFKNGDFYLP